MNPDNRHLRIGHAERDNAVAELSRARHDGRLSPEVVAERIERARAAVTVGDIDDLLADIVVELPRVPALPDSLPGTPALPASLASVPGYSHDDPLRLTAGFTSRKRRGQWVVPPFIQVQALVDDVRLDCLEAVAAHPVIDLEVLPGAGTVLLVLPEGWGVSIDRVTGAFGTVKSLVSAQPAWGNPMIVAHGSAGIGTFKARGANWFDKRRLGIDR